MKVLIRHAMLITPVVLALTAAAFIAYAGGAGDAGKASAPQRATMSIPF
jgi:hypothetical protein